MTPTRLRQIADRLERVCSNYQEKIGAGYKPCKGCNEAAEELRWFAIHGGLAEKRTPVDIVDHQPLGPRPAA